MSRPCGAPFASSADRQGFGRPGLSGHRPAGLVGTAEAVALNSVPWEQVFPDRRSPLFRLERKVGGGGGGVSGRPAQALNWRAVREIAADGTLPVIGPSVMREADVATGAEPRRAGGVVRGHPPAHAVEADRHRQSATSPPGSTLPAGAGADERAAA